jgi:hypothetical protein
MAPENEARPRADFYDHENETPARRRRPAADWGVNEDIFDRMPSRFSRVERRAEHHDVIVVSRNEREVASWGEDAWADQRAPSSEVVWDSERETWRTDTRTEPRTSAEVSAALDEWRAGSDRFAGDSRRGDDARGSARRPDDARGARSARAVDDWAAEERASRAADAWADEEADFGGHMLVAEQPKVDPWMDAAAGGTRQRNVDSWTDEAPGQSRQRNVDSWTEEAPGEPRQRNVDSWMDRAPGEPQQQRKVDSWMDDVPLVPGESRTIVLGHDESPAPTPATGGEAPQQRRTVKISGHPDRLPVVRTQRPPRSAVERIGASPDRIVAWTVALGFLLVLIAVLTTGQ